MSPIRSLISNPCLIPLSRFTVRTATPATPIPVCDWPISFARLGVPLDKDLRAQALTLCLIATGSDGYRVALSLAEVDPTLHPGEVIVADSYGGETLGADAPFRLIVSEDKRPARSVKNLVSIELKSVK